MGAGFTEDIEVHDKEMTLTVDVPDTKKIHPHPGKGSGGDTDKEGGETVPETVAALIVKKETKTERSV